MCQFKSAILLKDRVYVPDHDSHSDMLKELNIPDDMRHATETFVRVECIPADGDKLSDPMMWTVKVDQDIRPDWYIPEVDDMRVREAVKEWCDLHILREGEHEVKDGLWFAYNSAMVWAYGSAKVEAYDTAMVWAYGSAKVEASGSAMVILPAIFATGNPVKLSNKAVCVDHKRQLVTTAMGWTHQEHD